MKSLCFLLNIDVDFQVYKPGLISLVTAFLITIISIPPLLSIIKKFGFYDSPNSRKIHNNPVPTMGGIAIIAGMIASLFLWYPFANDIIQICFFLSVIVLFAMGIMDDLKDLPAKYKFIIQIGLATLITLSGVRITSFNGLFGINELPLFTQYTITVITIVGITNAFNLIDGIDGLAGGLGFMSLIVLGIFLTLGNDINSAVIAFALAGGTLAFLYFNFTPAKIFMGDTGSLVLGFIISFLCIRLMQANIVSANPLLPHAPVFVLGIVLIPVFDTARLFALRIWKGESPFTPGKNHIHHLLTNAGFSHGSAAKLIYLLHGFILAEVFWLRQVQQEIIVALLLGFMIMIILVFRNIKLLMKKSGIFSFRSIPETD